METVKSPEQASLALINYKSLIVDLVCNDLIASGNEVLFRSESIEDGLYQLSALKELPEVCIIDLDFKDRIVLAQLRELTKKYPGIHFIAHSDKDSEQAVKPLLEMGIESYLLTGSDTDDFRKAIEGVRNGKRYFSMGVADIAQGYFGNK